MLLGASPTRSVRDDAWSCDLASEKLNFGSIEAGNETDRTDKRGAGNS